jgi:hypothetical protein
LNHWLASRFATKSDSAVSDVVRPSIVKSAALRHRDQPQPIRQRLADFVEDVDRPGLAAPELLDQRDALLQLRLAGLELLHLRQHRRELLRLRFRGAMSASRRIPLSVDGPVPPADGDDRRDGRSAPRRW